jgi:hypothetical protein
MDNNSIKLTAPEISGLWRTYIQNTAIILNILISRGWMEQPPLDFDRKSVMKV